VYCRRLTIANRARDPCDSAYRGTFTAAIAKRASAAGVRNTVLTARKHDVTRHTVAMAVHATGRRCMHDGVHHVPDVGRVSFSSSRHGCTCRGSNMHEDSRPCGTHRTIIRLFRKVLIDDKSATPSGDSLCRYFSVRTLYSDHPG